MAKIHITALGFQGSVISRAGYFSPVIQKVITLMINVDIAGDGEHIRAVSLERCGMTLCCWHPSRWSLGVNTPVTFRLAFRYPDISIIRGHQTKVQHAPTNSKQRQSNNGKLGVRHHIPRVAG